MPATVYHYWNNQGSAHDSYHEMWMKTPDGWNLFTNDTPDGTWICEGIQENIPDFMGEDIDKYKVLFY